MKRLLKKILAFAAVVAAFALAGFVALALWEQWSVDVYFDNGMSQPVEITVDGKPPFVIAPRGRPTLETLAPGTHAVSVRAAGGGPVIEHGTIHIAKDGFLAFLSGHRIFIYNVAAAHIYKREAVIYRRPEAKGPQPQPAYLALRRFFEQRGIDFPFREPPREITVEASDTRQEVPHVALYVAPMTLHELAAELRSQGRNQKADLADRLWHTLGQTPPAEPPVFSEPADAP